MNKTITLIIAIICCTTVFAANGFLTKEELPNSYKILPAPPSTPTPNDKTKIKTPGFAQDAAISEQLYYTREHSSQKFFNGEVISQQRLDEAKSRCKYNNRIFFKDIYKPFKYFCS